MLYRMVKKETQRIQAILLCAIALSVTAPVQAQMMQQGANQGMARGVSRADSAGVGKVAYSGNWINRQIELGRKNFPIWGRRRVAGLFRRFVTPSEQELQVMSNWINHGSLSSQEQKVWNQYKRCVYSSRGAIAAIVGVVVAILAAIAGTAIGVSRKRAAAKKAPTAAGYKTDAIRPTVPTREELRAGIARQGRQVRPSQAEAQVAVEAAVAQAAAIEDREVQEATALEDTAAASGAGELASLREQASALPKEALENLAEAQQGLKKLQADLKREEEEDAIAAKEQSELLQQEKRHGIAPHEAQRIKNRLAELARERRVMDATIKGLKLELSIAQGQATQQREALRRAAVRAGVAVHKELVETLGSDIVQILGRVPKLGTVYTGFKEGKKYRYELLRDESPYFLRSLNVLRYLISEEIDGVVQPDITETLSELKNRIDALENPRIER